MSLPKNNQRDLFSASNILKDFLKEDDPMMIFSKEIYPLFKDEDFKDCYSEVGRNGISPSFLSAVTILQWKECLSDNEISEACINRLDWKIALHIPIEQNISFDPSTLCYFRKRLKENDKMSLIFDKIIQFAIKKDFIRNNTNQRIDATHIIKHVNRISTTDLLFRTVKCVVDEIKKMDKDFFDKYIPEYIKERYLNRFSSFGMSKEKRTDRQVEIVEDGLLIKKLLNEVKSEDLNKMKQIEIMDIIFNENVKISKKKINNNEYIEIEEIQCPKQTIFEPRDTSLQLGKKGKTSWVGSKCHIAETAEQGEINLITGMIQQEANRSDQLIHEKLNASNKKFKLRPEKIYADQNYISTESIKNYNENEQVLMGYIQLDQSKRHPDFKTGKFNIDLKNMTATCPDFKKSIKFSQHKGGDYFIYFSKKDCESCPNFLFCVTDKKNKRRSLHINKNYPFLKERRERQKNADFKKEMKVRAQVEGTISELVRFHGLRKAKYRNENGRQLQFYLSASALNTKRIIRILTKGKKIA